MVVNAEGVVRLYTGKMHRRSQRELYNYGFLANRFISKQKGQKVKVKGTKGKRHDQSLFCRTVRAQNVELFEALDAKYGDGKMKSVVAHVPDECMQVRKWGESHNQAVATDKSGMHKAPGWMAMTTQANGLLAQLGNKAMGVNIKKYVVDDLDPEFLLPIGDDLIDNQRPPSSSSSSCSSSSSSNNSSSNSSSNKSSSEKALEQAKARAERAKARENKNSSSSSSSS
jgi:hypothetical protein